MRINVTARDIKRGVQRHAGACPIALAVSRKVKGKQILVCLGGIYTKNPERGQVKSIGFLTKPANDWMGRYDAHGIGEPFSFTVAKSNSAVLRIEK
jgi:hypothetical protein